MKSRYKFYEDSGAYFITTTTVEWIPIFTSEKYFEIIRSSLLFCHENKKFKVHDYVIFENHIHLIISGKNLSDGMRDFKRFTAKKIIEQLRKDRKEWMLNQLQFFKKQYKNKSLFQVWQEGVHPKLIHTEEMLQQKQDYIFWNLVRKGYVCEPEHWRYSSASDRVFDDKAQL